jgi:hypothetical protein
VNGWVDVAALMDARDAGLFVGILEKHVSGLDATHWCEDHLLVDLPSTEDEVWFRLACMDETTLPQMRQFGDRSFLVPPCHQPDVHRWIIGTMLRKSIEVRNRIVHPKQFDDLTVSDDETTAAERGYFWFLAYVIEVSREHGDHLSATKAAYLRLVTDPHPEPT